MPAELTAESLRLDDPGRTADEIAERLREVVYKDLRRRGAVVGLSGGVDSSLVAFLCARAFGPERVLGVLMPEGESASDTLDLSRSPPRRPASRPSLEDITELLQAAGCYERRDAAIRTVMPEYGAGWKAKIVLPSLLGGSRYSLFTVVAESPEGERREARLTATAYREVVAATNFKQRVRKMLEYYHADRLDYAVVGTPNRLEYDQGFFVKNGDGSADVKPIAHLYKTQVYQLAEALGVPGGDPRAPADDRHLRARAEPGGVLLLRPVRQARPLPVRPQPGAPGRSGRGRRRPRPRRSSSASTRTSSASGAPPRTCMRRRSSSPSSSGIRQAPRPSRGRRARPHRPQVWARRRARRFQQVSPRDFAHDRKMSYGLSPSCSPIERRPFR